ncbi:O-antigen ligase family protein [Paludisphaera borealis]|uniref:O-antigen ligase-related domain-containing protein n=1 Tax=Paludisphaera borealis TaxID=1387353 RepID=A0A1U7CPZ4_9BACT|nr:O-antigen ligase family protein [Paludisphaera borealis]APW61015.1 hypothetical protein BSF38_02518 [Paludisphaera borealis]
MRGARPPKLSNERRGGSRTEGPANSWNDHDHDDKEEAALRLAERTRRLALGLLAALVVARAFWPSEPNLKEGAGAGLVWVVAVFLVGGMALLPSLVTGKFAFRWAPTDAAVIVLTALVAISSRRGVDWRIAINLAWEWVALGIVYLLLRILPRTRGESSALALAFAATAAAVAAYGLFQGAVELPELQNAYRRDPARILAEMKIEPGTPAQQAFESRLIGSNEVYSTFGLPNSLAGFLVGPLVLVLGLALQNLARSGDRGSRWGSLVMAAPPTLLILVCLTLTKSRSAWLGLLVASAILAWRSRRLLPRREFVGLLVAGAVVVVGLTAAGLATKRLDPQVLTQSSMSMRYRLEYWRGAWGVISEGAPSFARALGTYTFWAGVGPGNFGSHYLLHKLPQSSEEIQDPHNLFFEVWATAGVWALIALLTALGSALWFLLKPVADATAEPEPASPDDLPGRSTWLVFAAGMGWVMVILLGRMNLFQDDLLPRWLILGFAWLLAALLLAPLWRRSPMPSFVFGAAAAAIVINLLAAGGIGIPTVALGLWSLIALGLNQRENALSGRLRTVESRLPAFALGVVGAAVAGTFVGYTVPFWQSEAEIAKAEEFIAHRPPDFEKAENAYVRAEQLDHYNARAWVGHAYLQFLAWQSRGAKPEDLRWKTILIQMTKAVEPPRSPDSWTLHSERAGMTRMLLNRVASTLSPRETIQMQAKIVEATRTASRLYPTNAMLRARLAEASAEVSMFKDAVKEADEALRLDVLLAPHPDKRLPAAVRKQLQEKKSEWAEKAKQGGLPATP